MSNRVLKLGGDLTVIYLSARPVSVVSSHRGSVVGKS